MSWFYNKEIILMEQDGSLVRGSWVESIPTEIKLIPCDVQPANRELIFKEYGYYIDCNYRVFCDADSSLDVGAMVKYDGDLFDLVKIIKWDDYLDMFINEHKGDVSNG